MGLFDKKYCDICGEKIGLLGNRKVEDGNVCSSCVKKLSPFFTGRKKSTVEDIKQQIAYREQNRQNLNSFNPMRSFGRKTKVYIDDSQGCFIVSRRNDFREENADIISLSQVQNARFEVEEHRSEIYRTNSEGKRVSYTPPRYEYAYEFSIEIDVNSPYFSEIKFELTDDRPDSRNSAEYRRFEQEANELVASLTGRGFQQPMGYGAPMGYAQQQYGQPQGYPQQQYGQPQGYPPASGLSSAAVRPASGLSSAAVRPASGLSSAAVRPASGLSPAAVRSASGLSSAAVRSASALRSAAVRSALPSAAEHSSAAVRPAARSVRSASTAGRLDMPRLRSRQYGQILR